MKKIAFILVATMLISMFTSVYSASAATVFNIKEDAAIAKEVQDERLFFTFFLILIYSIKRYSKHIQKHV